MNRGTAPKLWCTALECTSSATTVMVWQRELGDFPGYPWRKEPRGFCAAHARDATQYNAFIDRFMRRYKQVHQAEFTDDSPCYGWCTCDPALMTLWWLAMVLGSRLWHDLMVPDNWALALCQLRAGACTNSLDDEDESGDGPPRGIMWCKRGAPTRRRSPGRREL